MKTLLLLITVTAFGTYMNNQDNKPLRQLSYLALGDSYTIGEMVSADQSFPYQLTAGLNKTKPHVAPPTMIATTGWTTDELINAIGQSDAAHKKYDFVTLLVGVND